MKYHPPELPSSVDQLLEAFPEAVREMSFMLKCFIVWNVIQSLVFVAFLIGKLS